MNMHRKNLLEEQLVGFPLSISSSSTKIISMKIFQYASNSQRQTQHSKKEHGDSLQKVTDSRSMKH